jgi:hypothetical protein
MRQRWMAEYRNDPRGCAAPTKPQPYPAHPGLPPRRRRARPLALAGSAGSAVRACPQALRPGLLRSAPVPAQRLSETPSARRRARTSRSRAAASHSGRSCQGGPKHWGTAKPRLRVRSRAAARALARLRKQPLHLVCGSVVPILPTIDAAFKSVHMGVRDNKCAPPGIGLHTLSHHTPRALLLVRDGSAGSRLQAARLCPAPACPSLSPRQWRCWRIAGEEMLHWQVNLQIHEICIWRCSAAAETVASLQAERCRARPPSPKTQGARVRRCALRKCPRDRPRAAPARACT